MKFKHLVSSNINFNLKDCFSKKVDLENDQEISCTQSSDSNFSQSSSIITPSKNFHF